jgi:hypothetical protein
MSTKQQCVHLSKTCCQTLKHFNNVISNCCENVVDVFESLNVFCYFFQTFSPHMGSLKSHTKRPLYRNQDESFTMNNDNTFYHEYPNKPFINDDYRQTKPTKALFPTVAKTLSTCLKVHAAQNGFQFDVHSPPGII